MTESAAQGSDAWLKIRLGKVTASRVSDVVARTKTGWGASRANYAAQLVVERLTGEPQESYQNAAMLHGIETEPHARAAYEFQTDATVTQVGFIIHPRIELSGASPDGFVGDDGLIEVKCPQSGTHIETLLGREVPGKYLTQIQWQLACTGRAWCDFVCFDPRMPESMRLFVRRVHRDDVMIADLEKNVRDFLAEIESTLRQLRAYAA